MCQNRNLTLYNILCKNLHHVVFWIAKNGVSVNFYASQSLGAKLCVTNLFKAWHRLTRTPLRTWFTCCEHRGPWHMPSLHDRGQGSMNVRFWCARLARMRHALREYGGLAVLMLHQRLQKPPQGILGPFDVQFVQSNSAAIWFLMFQIQRCNWNF